MGPFRLHAGRSLVQGARIPPSQGLSYSSNTAQSGLTDATVQGVAQFHLNNLFPDLRFNDSTLVVNPCNSPEQNPITMGKLLIRLRIASHA